MSRYLIFILLGPLCGAVPGFLIFLLVFNIWPTPEMVGIGGPFWIGGGFIAGLVPSLLAAVADWWFAREHVDRRMLWTSLVGALSAFLLTVFVLPGILPYLAAYCVLVSTAVCSYLSGSAA